MQTETMKKLAVVLILAGFVPRANAQSPRHFTVAHRVAFVAGTEADRRQFQAVPAASGIIVGDFVIGREDMNDDGSEEVILMAQSSIACGSGGCATVVLEQRGPRFVAIFHQNLFAALAVTNEKTGSYRALATVDANNTILVGDKKATPMYGKQLVYGMKP